MTSAWRNASIAALVSVAGAAHCGGEQSGPTCPPGQISCGGSCTTLHEDPQNCGACGTECAKGTVCFDGSCATSCGGGTIQCGQSCVDTNVDRDNCGACGAKCAAGDVCVGAQCSSSCEGDQALCVIDGGAAYCANRKTDDANCGACGVACGAQQVCSEGVCASTCAAAQTFCNGTDGGAPYCADLESDNMNCGACSYACDPSLSCVDGTCAPACPVNQAACFPQNAQPYCADTAHDPENCGSCGNSCGTGPTICPGGWCACSDSSKTWCAGDGCIDVQTDPSNCGACNKTCAGTCSDGHCVVTIAGPTNNSEYWIDADANRVYLSNGISVSSIPNGGGTPTNLTSGYTASNLGEITSDASYVYFVDGWLPVTIGRVPKTGGPVDVLATLDDFRSNVATDGVNVYVRGANYVYSVPVGGGSPVSIAASDGSSLMEHGICTDGTTVFWASVNGLMATPVVGGPTKAIVPGQIDEVLCSGSWVYYLANSYPSRTPTSGSGKVEIVSLTYGYLAVGNEIYVAQGPQIWSIDLNSLAATELVDDADLDPVTPAIVASSSFVTWVDYFGGAVEQVAP